MKHLPTLKGQLKELLLEGGMAAAMHRLRDKLPPDAPKYNALLQLEAECRELETQMIRGLLSFEQAGLQSNRLRERLLALIDGLEAGDFSPQLRRSRFRKEEKVRCGHVLYRIPHTMQVGAPHRCLVRIAFDKEMLLEGLRVDEHTQIRENLRVSDYMKVALVDPSPAQVFEIRSTSPSEQVVDEDDHTEWRFYVKPLVPGHHVLELKVVIMVVMEDGRTMPREKTLEESVVIVSEPEVAPEAEPAFKTLEESLLLSRNIEARESGFRLPKGLQAIAGALALLMLASTATYALAPQEAAWAYTRYLRNSKAAYEQYIESYPESRHVETAAYRRAKVGQDPEAYEGYLTQYENGKYEQQAAWEVAELTRAPIAYLRYLHEFPEGIKAQAAQARLREMEPRVWQAIQQQPTLQVVDQYLALYPESDRRETALAYLSDSSLWRSPLEGITPLLDRITGQSLEERLLAHAKAAPSAAALESFIAQTNNPALVEEARRALKNYQPPASKEETAGKQAADAPSSQDEPGEQPASSTENREATEKGEVANPLLQNTLVEQPAITEQKPPSPCATQGGDADGDGLCDDQDACVDQPGPAANKGCPERSPQPSGFDETSLGKDFPMPEMVKIEGGAFIMGCQAGRDTDCDGDEKPDHKVTVSTFYLSRYEVTQEQWRAVMGSDPPELYNKGCDQCPVERVSWNDIREFIQKLNAMTGQRFRLPTEAEWEYAARGGRQSRGYLYSGGNNIDEVAWYDGNYKQGNTHGEQRTTRPVGGKKANELGLYDMSGNVWEWVEDVWHENYQGAPTDGSAWLAGGDSGPRVLRGGSWYFNARNARLAIRGRSTGVGRYGYSGFRLARD